MQVLIHRMNQTAHISLQKPAISKSARQNRPGRLNFGAARLLLPQSFCQSSVAAVSVRGFYVRVRHDARGYFDKFLIFSRLFPAQDPRHRKSPETR